jgi:transporter family protein
MNSKNFLLALLIALLSGTAAIFEKASLRDASPTTVFTLRSLYMTLCLGGFCLLAGDWRSLFQISGRTLLLIVIPATFALAFLSLYYSVLKQDLASRVIPIISGVPLVTVLLSVLFLGEPFSWKRLAGAVLIVVGVSLVK